MPFELSKIISIAMKRTDVTQAHALDISAHITVKYDANTERFLWPDCLCTVDPDVLFEYGWLLFRQSRQRITPGDFPADRVSYTHRTVMIDPSAEFAPAEWLALLLNLSATFDIDQPPRFPNSPQ